MIPVLTPIFVKPFLTTCCNWTEVKTMILDRMSLRAISIMSIPRELRGAVRGYMTSATSWGVRGIMDCNGATSMTPQTTHKRG